MPTVYIEISQEDEKEVLALAKKVAESNVLFRIKHATSLLQWIFHKKSHGLKIQKLDACNWHVIVPPTTPPTSS